MLDPVELDVIGALEGSDKCSSVASAWDYLRHFEVLFAEFRAENINFIEVGLAKGASLKIWKWFFTQAKIIGIDIQPACRAYADERVSVEIGSQADGAFLADVCERFPPTIFIDDGSHLAAHNIFTFETVFPHILPGGLYVVEDLAFHFGPGAGRWQAEQKADAPGYFLDLARYCLAAGRGDFAPQAQADLADSVEMVLFIGGAAILRKRRAPRDLVRGLACAQAYIQAAGNPGRMQARLATWLLRHHGPADAVATALVAAEAGGERGAEFPLLRAKLLRRQGRPAEAITVLADAVARPGTDAHLLRSMTRDLAGLGAYDAALVAIDKAIAVEPANLANITLRAKLLQRNRAP